jgi:hypothetical protein
MAVDEKKARPDPEETFESRSCEGKRQDLSLSIDGRVEGLARETTYI